ncbi:response regulator transcription factor [Tepidibacter thalassicus]|uniref:Stage 0 sporulation protein A homolog n=1 Tax=Tepidibacter thalassicus DSM 15285 TaxID=1123350 RepID=A0A1M5QTN2_9FIRM|nr:response regulator transcription factor [Tepidibacter thalassicus]SHH17455.1 DNA-binding response regulator, OmpR family, contains REC and winged-helix (wHTH) domain [Tepidibacter thalassicus DSM 15285]
MKYKILVLEDEKSIRTFIKIKLKALGYEIVEFENGDEALKKVDKTIDIALLDVMLPDIDGFEVCKMLRKEYPDIGIIMITAKGQENDKVKGFKCGADDYIVKPFSPKELGARIEALIRRIDRNKEIKNIIEHKPFKIDINKKSLVKNNEIIPLTPTEYAIMEFFMTNPNKVMSRDEILDKVWGESYFGEIKTVDVNIRRIRQKIEEDSSNPKYLKTIRGYGYIWSVENE